MRSPPTIDMAMAGVVMRAQCASNIGKAAMRTDQQPMLSMTFHLSALLGRIREGQKHTDTHYNQESRAEPPKVDDGISSILHEIIWVRTSSAYPIRQRCNHIGSDNE